MITVRRFSAEDQAGVMGLAREIMEQELPEEKEVYPLDDVTNVLEAYGGLGEAFFVAISEKGIIGTVGIKKESDRVALLRRLFVASAHRNKRIGLKLIECAMDFCDKVGYQEIIIKTTSRMEAANQACQKQGFVQRAKLQCGPIELLKFSLSLRDGAKKAKSSS